MLTSEDTELLRALSGYVAVAIDNSLLYRSEMEKAEELARLKEFSENIIESVNVGILVVDFDGRISTWNSALEEILGVARERALRRNIDDILDRDLIETIQNVIGQEGWAIRDTRHIYKYNASTEDSRPLTLNVSLAPFEAARGVVTIKTQYPEHESSDAPAIVDYTVLVPRTARLDQITLVNGTLETAGLQAKCGPRR